MSPMGGAGGLLTITAHLPKIIDQFGRNLSKMTDIENQKGYWL